MESKGRKKVRAAMEEAIAGLSAKEEVKAVMEEEISEIAVKEQTGIDTHFKIIEESLL